MSSIPTLLLLPVNSVCLSKRLRWLQKKQQHFCKGQKGSFHLVGITSTTTTPAASIASRRICLFFCWNDKADIEIKFLGWAATFLLPNVSVSDSSPFCASHSSLADQSVSQHQVPMVSLGCLERPLVRPTIPSIDLSFLELKWCPEGGILWQM